MKFIQRYKKTLAMSAAALGLLAGLTIDSSMAYFTTYVSAGGSEVVNLEAKTEIQEKVDHMTKHIVLKNTSDKGDCFVRVKVFCGGGLTLNYIDASGNWEENKEDGYWYYKSVVPVGGVTTGLDVFIDTTGLEKRDETDPNKIVGYLKDKFNVIVVQECTPALYNENGEAYADWNTVYTTAGDTQGEEAEG